MTTCEEVLKRDGRLVYRIRGTSMMPMLRQNKDIVVIERPEGRAERFDTVLYRRGKAYVLHRVIRVKEDGYVIYGDNTFSAENVPDSAVIGILTAFVRGGREISAGNSIYRMYVRIWHAIFPVRYVLFLMRRAASKVKHKLIG